MSLPRYPDWPARLDAFLSSNLSRPFSYGSWDCCLFATSCIEVMTGVDLSAPLLSLSPSPYSSRSTALALCAQYSGQRSVGALVTKAFAEAGLELCASPLQARRGDAVLIDRAKARPEPRHRGRDLSLGVVALNGQDAMIVSNRGLWRVPLTYAVRAWHV